MLPESESVRQTNDSRRERICYTAEWNSAKIRKNSSRSNSISETQSRSQKTENLE